jgi:hypothetical protein
MKAAYPYSDEAWRFVWERILVGASGCWLWTGGRMGGCYPGTSFGHLVYRPHQMIWEMVNSRPFPVGLLTRHICDQTICVRHVIPGTHSQNAADRSRVFGGSRRRPSADDEVLAMETRIAQDLSSHVWPDISAIPSKYADLAEFEIEPSLTGGVL